MQSFSGEFFCVSAENLLSQTYTDVCHIYFHDIDATSNWLLFSSVVWKFMFSNMNFSSATNIHRQSTSENEII